MNILYLINELQLGGSQLGALKEIKHLTEKGHKITVVARTGTLKLEFEKLSHNVEIVTLPIYGLPKKIKNQKDRIKNNTINTLRSVRRLRLPRSVYKVRNIIIRENIDVIYACQPGPSQIAHIVSKMTKVPFIIRVQHVLSNEFPMLFYNKVISDSSGISVITHEIKEFIEKEYGVRNKKIDVIPTCIDLDNYLKAKDLKYNDIKTKLSINEDDIVIVSIATHREDKMRPIESLMASVDKLSEEYPNLKCILVGDGSYQQEVCNKADIINEKHRRKIIIPVGRKMDLNPYLSIADLGIGVGRCAMEFLSSGNALICASNQGFAGLFTKEQSMQISAYNFSGRNTNQICNNENMYKSITQYLKMNSIEQEQLKKFGQDFIISNYSTNKIIDETELLLENAIKTSEL